LARGHKDALRQQDTIRSGKRSEIQVWTEAVVVRMRNQPIIQVSVGSEKMSDEELVNNIQAVLRLLEGKLKRGLKNVKFAFIKTSMGSPVKIKP